MGRGPAHDLRRPLALEGGLREDLRRLLREGWRDPRGNGREEAGHGIDKRGRRGPAGDLPELGGAHRAPGRRDQGSHRRLPRATGSSTSWIRLLFERIFSSSFFLSVSLFLPV